MAPAPSEVPEPVALPGLVAPAVGAGLAVLRQLADTLLTLPPPVAAFNETDLLIRVKHEKLLSVIRMRLMESGLDEPSIALVMMHLAGFPHSELHVMLMSRPELLGDYLDQV